MKKLQKGKPIEELVKGSMDYTMQLIRDAFRRQYPDPMNTDGPYYYINEIFADYLIVSGYGAAWPLKADEYYKVTYEKSGDNYQFAARADWEVVELAYKPQTLQVMEKSKSRKSRKAKWLEERAGGKTFEERGGDIELAEKKEGELRHIRANDVIVAGVINGNGRRYPSDVIRSAVEEVKTHLNESAGQGRIVQYLGEAEHPSDKNTRRPNLLETVIKWDEISFDGKTVSLGGVIPETSKGKDILALMEGGIRPGVSLRGYGEAESKKENGEKFDEVTELHITGFDAVLEPSFEAAEVVLESKQGDDEMNIEELLQLLKDHPEIFQGVTEAQIKKMGEEQLKKLEEKIRSVMGIDANANINESLNALKEKAQKFDESERKAAVDKAIEEACKGLPYPKEMAEQFVESIKSANPKDAEAVKPLVESKQKEYDALTAKLKLGSMGFKAGAQVIGPVLEKETGVPEFARVAFEITESVRKNENRAKPNLVLRAESPAGVFTAKLLERFDKVYQRQLIEESRQFAEAELTTDLNLPYSVSRAIIAEAYPNLVAANVFDVGVMEQSPMRLYYEAFAGETGYSVVITDEVVTGGAEEVWYDLAHKNVVPGTVVVTSNPAGTTYVEGTDFVIDYELGKVKFLAAGSIGANDILADYTYHATRQGENAEIERAKVTLSYQTLEAGAWRISDYISHEAIVFSRSQLGWDAVGRTMANLIRQVRLDIDKALMEKALAAALGVANNSGGTWDISDAVYATLVKMLGVAKMLVANRFYEPTAYLMSMTNADYLSNWDGFKRDGFPDAVLTAAGFVGTVKGLPVFATTQMRDTWFLCVNRQIVLHRVFQPIAIKGPFPTYSNGKLIAAEQYYAEEYNASLAPIGGKASYVLTQA